MSYELRPVSVTSGGSTAHIAVYVCKTCGRLVDAVSGVPPRFCYYDKIQTMESVSPDNVEAFNSGRFQDIPLFTGYQFEFPGDVKYHPGTGEALDFNREGLKTLTEFQSEVMLGVVGGTSQ